MIEFRNVTKRFKDGLAALSNLSVKINQGEFVSIIGRSGAGKSTFLRLINGTILPTEGTVQTLTHMIDTKTSAEDLRLTRREVGFVFQHHNLIAKHSVLSNVLMGRLGYKNTIQGLLGLFSPEEKNMAKTILSEVGLSDHIVKRVDELSGGQQQRVAIARALVQEPKIILADEPMASLDPKLSEVVLELLYKFNQERGISVLTNVHVLDLAKKRADRILGFKRGVLVFDGTPAELNDAAVNLIYGE